MRGVASAGAYFMYYKKCNDDPNPFPTDQVNAEGVSLRATAEYSSRIRLNVYLLKKNIVFAWRSMKKKKKRISASTYIYVLYIHNRIVLGTYYYYKFINHKTICFIVYRK
jgi:hypothetical protein